MTALTCKTVTDGCYRCGLNRDEIEANLAEDRADAQAAWIEYRDQYIANAEANAAAGAWDVASATRRTLRRCEFVAGFMAGRQG